MPPQLEHLLLTSLPNIATIFVGVGLFCSAYPRREPFARRLAVVALSCVGIALASAILHTLVTPPLVERFGGAALVVVDVLFFGFVLLCCLVLVQQAFELGTWDAVFCCTAGYLLQNTAHSCIELVWTILPPWLTDISPVMQTATLYAITATVYAAAYLLLVRRLRTRRLMGGADRRMVVMLVGVMVVSIALNSIVYVLFNDGTADILTHAVMRSLQMLVNVLLLTLDYQILYSNRLTADVAAGRQLAADERRQYQISRETVEAVNRRMHDIRHGIGRLSNAGGALDPDIVRELTRLVSVYDANVHTGNPALDVVLTEKGLLCQQRGIQLNAAVDGPSLSFMDEADIYALLGGALDVAMRACEKLDDDERLLIDVSVGSSGKMRSLQVRTFFKNGVLTSEDELRPLRLVAERYDGNVSVSANDGLLRLNVLLVIE